MYAERLSKSKQDTRARLCIMEIPMSNYCSVVILGCCLSGEKCPREMVGEGVNVQRDRNREDDFVSSWVQQTCGWWWLSEEWGRNIISFTAIVLGGEKA